MLNNFLILVIFNQLCPTLHNQIVINNTILMGILLNLVMIHFADLIMKMILFMLEPIILNCHLMLIKFDFYYIFSIKRN